MTDTAKYLRAAEIARRLGLSERTVRRRIADKTLPSAKIGGARLVAQADLARLHLFVSREFDEPAVG